MSLEDKLQQGKLNVTSELKKSIFDIIAAVIILAVIAASLDIFGLFDLQNINFLEFIVSWMPYFLASILLNLDLYKKGVFVGKSTKKFITVADSYSNIANSLSGQQIKDLQPFCDKYNEDAIISIRSKILRNEGISYEMYDTGYTLDGIKIPALKTLSKKELTEFKFNKLQIKAVFKAKKVSVKGISVNLLLSNINVKDPTNIGDNEHNLANKHVTISTIKYLISTLFMSVIAIKDVAVWGWAGIILVLFKVMYMFAGCYMSYFKAYDDITINVANHLTRKSDLLKMYLQYVPEVTEDAADEEVEIQHSLDV